MNRRSFLSPLMALALIAPLGAQIDPFGWIGDDGFDIGCCAPVNQVNLPQFPAIETDGIYCCIKDCALEAEFRILVRTQHIPLICDLALIPFSVSPATVGGPGWAGTLIAKYARTWVEAGPLGENQVWRWLVNTDAFPTAGAAPCPIPDHPANLATHFTGHIDYACVIDENVPGALAFRRAINLNHLPGCISHSPFSASPLAVADAHHDRSYHIVAPGTFVCEPVAPPEGPTPADAVRTTLLPGYRRPAQPITWLGELKVENGEIRPEFQECLCSLVTPPVGPFLWTHEAILGFAFCPDGTIPPTPFAGLPLPPPLPPLPTGFTTFGLGRWTGIDQFPGARDLNIHFGVLTYQDPCDPLIPVHVVTGVSTRYEPGGLIFGAHDPAVTGPYPGFTDLTNMILRNGLFGANTLGFGTWFMSGVVWNLNTFF